MKLKSAENSGELTSCQSLYFFPTKTKQISLSLSKLGRNLEREIRNHNKMDQIMGNLGTYWFTNKASQDAGKVSKDINVSFYIISLFSI